MVRHQSKGQEARRSERGGGGRRRVCVGSAGDRRARFVHGRGRCPRLGWGDHPVSGKRPPRSGAVEGPGESEGFGVGFGESELRGLLLWDGSVDKDAG